MKILIVGTDFSSPNNLKTQGQFLKDVLSKHLKKVSITSVYRNYLLRTLDTLWQIIKLNRNDVTIVQVYSSKGIYLEYAAVLFGRLRGCKIISTLHGGNIPHVYHHSVNKRWLLNQIFNLSHIVTAPSSFIPEQIPSLQNRHIIIRNIIDLSSYQTYTPVTGNKIRILWMRAYHPTYNPMLAIQVFESLLNQGVPIEMVMAGSDLGFKHEITEYIKSKSYTSKVRLLDVIDDKMKNKLASQSTVYLSTNKIDNAPVSFIEMMAMGLPVVSTNIGGIPYYVTNGKTALLSNDNTPQDIASLILQLNSNDQLRNILIQNGLTFSKEFSAENVAEQWTRLISKITST